MGKKLSRAIKCATAVGLSLFLAVSIYCVLRREFLREPLPKVFGFCSAFVVSGSMEPAIQTGDLVFIRQSGGYVPGDVVIYLREDGALITHRIVASGPQEVILRGDANSRNDAPIQPCQIEGKIIGRLPGAGNLVYQLGRPAGIALVASFALLWLLLPALRRKAQQGKAVYPGAPLVE